MKRIKRLNELTNPDKYEDGECREEVEILSGLYVNTGRMGSIPMTVSSLKDIVLVADNYLSKSVSNLGRHIFSAIIKKTGQQVIFGGNIKRVGNCCKCGENK